MLFCRTGELGNRRTFLISGDMRSWQAHSQKFAMGEEANSEAGNNIQKSYLRFWSVFTQIESVLQSKFRRSPEKKIFKIFFLANYKILTIQKILCPREDRAFFEDLRLRGPGLDLQGPRTSSRTPPLLSSTVEVKLHHWVINWWNV